MYLVFEVGVSDTPTFLIINVENSMSKKLHSPKVVQSSPKGDHAAKHQTTQRQNDNSSPGFRIDYKQDWQANVFQDAAASNDVSG